MTPHAEIPAGDASYLPITPFTDGQGSGGYDVEVTRSGVTVYSECCADTMSVGTARALHEALGRYLADHPGEQP